MSRVRIGITRRLTAALAGCAAVGLATAAPATDTVPTHAGSFDSAGVTIAYLEAGQGDPVVLVHGLYSSAETNFVRPGTFQMLAAHHRVIALDLRGHGQSGRPTDESAYGQPMVEDVVRLMDHLHVAKAHVVGYSLGGIVAMKVMIDHPDRVISGTLGGMGWLRAGSFEQGIFERMGNRLAARTPPACVHGIAKLAVTAAQLRQVKVPVEILVGDRDPCRRLYVEPLERERPDWPVVLIGGAGHLNCIFKEQFRSGVAGWIDANAR
jgi:pimeloyl-ACP methyl ester carboxylesterase